MNRPVDWQARAAARDTMHSCIVQAPAGSGKTELLSQRLLGLLAEVENPEEVIAITFTRKAAAEMRNRLLGHLQNANAPATTEPLSEHEQISRTLALAVLANDSKRGWNLLQQPGRLRILTIDSLCSNLAGQLPILSGLGSTHKINSKPDSLYREAASRTMAQIESSNSELKPDIVRILNRYDNKYDGIIDLIASMLASREQWLSHILSSKTNAGFDRDSLETALTYLVETQLQQTQQQLPEQILTTLPSLYNYALSNQAENKAELLQLLDACGGQDSQYLHLATNAAALPHWRTLIDSLLTKAGGWRKSVSAAAGFPAPSGAKGEEKEIRQLWKNKFLELLSSINKDDSLLELLQLTRSLPQPSYADEDWESLQSLLHILIHAAGQLAVLMAESGEVDFTEISVRAIQALGDEGAPSELALRLDYRISHLLVDEFQDTSRSQIELINRLTTGWEDGDGRTLFLVGDPMQSIYRFRKAEVSLFIRAWEGELFEHIALQALELSVNFRSNQEVVDWVNQTFPVIMPTKNDPINAAVRYSPSDTQPAVKDLGSVNCKIFAKRDDELEARQIIQLIGSIDKSQSVAILVRSRSHASEILFALDKLKEKQTRFRYQAIDFIGLSETPIIQDLLSLTLAITQLADRLSWLAILRAPFIGLDLSDLDELIDGNDKITILESLQERAEIFSGDAKQRLQRALPILVSAIDKTGRSPVSSIIADCWLKLGGPACISNPSELLDAKTYFKLIQELEAEGLAIDQDSLQLGLENLYAQPDSKASELLQIITIHRAKGLQFDHIILPGLNRKSSGDKSKLLYWFELAEQDRDSSQIVMSLMRNSADKEKVKTSSDLIAFISGIEKKRQSYEDGRLLYVAVTRAIQSIHLFAAIDSQKKEQIKPTSGSLLEQLWPAIYSKQTALVRKLHEQAETTATNQHETNQAKTQLWRRLEANWELPLPSASTARVKSETPEASDYIQFDWAGQGARHTGDLVHRLLERIGNIGISSWTEQGGFEQVREWCRQRLVSEGVTGPQAERIIHLCETAITNCVNSDKGRWILKDHQESACEYAITALLEDKVKSMILDRTFIADGTRWIIDYKTSSHAGGDLETFLEQESNRYRKQLQTYKKALSLTEELPIKIALYFPLLGQFKEIV